MVSIGLLAGVRRSDEGIQVFVAEHVKEFRKAKDRRAPTPAKAAPKEPEWVVRRKPQHHGANSHVGSASSQNLQNSDTISRL